MGWLHRLPHHSHEIASQRLEVGLVSQLRGECLDGLPRVVLAPVKATIYERLYATPQRAEQRRYEERRSDHGERRFFASEGHEHPLQQHYSSEVECHEHRRKGAVDEGAVDDYVYVVEPIAKNGYPHGDGNGRYQQEKNRLPDPLEPEGHLYHVGDDFGKYEAHDCCGSGVSEPLDLLALYPCGPMQAHKHR